MTATVKKIGGSMAVLIPKAMAREMELTEGTAIELTTTGDAVVIRKQRRARRKRRPIAEIVAQMDPAAYRRRNKELRDGGPVGRELW